MEPVIGSGKHLAENADLAGSRFHDVNLADAVFDDVNMRGVTFQNIDMSDITVRGVHMGGARFSCIGLPPGAEGRQRPMGFEAADLNGTIFSKCDMSGVCIENCCTEGMTIDGVLVTDLQAAYAGKIKKP
jgi:uncharacterized protein YjbI with pentapeptide repeats